MFTKDKVLRKKKSALTAGIPLLVMTVIAIVGNGLIYDTRFSTFFSFICKNRSEQSAPDN